MSSTVDNGKEKDGNRFELVLAASYRARSLSAGCVSGLERSAGHKNTVLALRELETGVISVHDTMEAWIRSLQKSVAAGELEGVEIQDKDASSVMLPAIEADNGSSSSQFDEITEDDLLRYLEELAPPGESSGD